MGAPDRPRLTVIVPAYEEAGHVRGHLHRIAAAVEALRRPFEILLVDDGSRDATEAEARAASAEDSRVRVVRHAENRGKGAALATGCAHAAGDVLVFLDADLEIAPEEVGPLLAAMEAAGADVAVASKYLEGSVERRPLHRVLLSRLYLVVTSLLFRLPIRDTQTGLKAIRRDLARAVVPALVTRRWAWDVELLLLAHKAGARFVSAPVTVDFRERGVRIGWRGFLASGFDTVATFVRDRWLGAYGRPLARARGVPGGPPRPPRVVLSGDDLGLSPSVDRGLVSALAQGRLTSVSFLAGGPTAASAAAAVAGCRPAPDVGVHVDLAAGRLATYVLRGALGLVPAGEVRAAVRAQVQEARRLGLEPTHADAHRHAFFPPPVYRAFAAEARAQGLRAVRFPAPAGGLRCGPGWRGRAKALLLLAASVALRGVARAHGLARTDGIADAAVAADWVRAGRLPRSVRRGTVEVVAHPADGPDDVPRGERGVDRARDASLLATLRAGLESLGAAATDFSTAADGVLGGEYKAVAARAAREARWTSSGSSPSSPRSSRGSSTRA